MSSTQRAATLLCSSERTRTSRMKWSVSAFGFARSLCRTVTRSGYLIGLFAVSVLSVQPLDCSMQAANSQFVIRAYGPQDHAYSARRHQSLPLISMLPVHGGKVCAPIDSSTFSPPVVRYVVNVPCHTVNVVLNPGIESIIPL